MKIKKIAIDPGHGGSDPGVTSGNHSEKDINLKLASELFTQLLDTCYNPLLLREGDLYMNLSSRVQKAVDWEADLFISLHHNGHSNKSARGTETYHFPNSKIGKKAAKFIHQELTALLSAPDRGIKSNNRFYILRHTPMPSVLLEPLFVTNKLDQNILICENYYSKVSSCLIRALNQLNEIFRREEKTQ